jgi:serine/threonine-protein kinase RsbW
MAVEGVSSTDRIVIELPPKPEFVGTGRMVVAAVARHHAFGDEQVEDLKVAVSEALTNSVRAHEAAGIVDSVSLVVWAADGALVVEIRDRGLGFDPEAVVQFGATPVPGTLESGLGLMLIRSLISDTHIERIEGSGMLIRMTLKREEAASEL